MSRRFSPRVYVGIISAAVLSALPLASYAACNLVPTGGDDEFTCDSGSSPALVDTGGNNKLTFPAGGDGAINGNVTFGPGNDTVTMNSGTIAGAVDMGTGVNIFQLFGGTVTGNITQGAGTGAAANTSVGNILISLGSAGAITQGVGNTSLNVFSMSGGTIDSVTQGDGNNKVSLSTGRINGDVTGGNGNNTFLISGGNIGGNVSYGDGNNDMTVFNGGDIAGSIRTGNGDNVFTWNTAGLVHGPIVTGSGTDLAFLNNLTETTLSSTPLIDGGLGTDRLVFENTTATTPSRYADWETVELNNGSVFTLGGDFKLGDSGTHTGTFSINGASTLVVNQGSISPFTAGQLVTVYNNNLIDMTSSSSVATDVLTINGNYTASNGQLALQSVLAGDDSPSDKLVVSQGMISGNTNIIVTNLGGPGGQTVQNGIQVVQATNGATGSDLAFSLRNGYVSAGAFEYYLYKGGVTPGTAQNWYLRSSIEAPPLPNPEGPPSGIFPPVPPDPSSPDTPVGIFPPVPADGTPETPGIFPGEEPIPIYRPEVPEYSVLFPAIQQMVQGMLGTYHERMGEQSPQPASGGFSAGWGRFYGSSSRQSFSGTVSPTLDSSITGYQVGTDLYDWTNDDGLTQRVGIFVGHSRLTGDISGFAGGFQNADVGNTTLRADSLGTYWTLIGANRAYLDLVLMGTRFDGNSESVHGVKLQTKGHNILGSAEVGWPFPISQHWELEPQAQLIIDRSYLDSQNDGISDVSFKADTNVTTRLGVRLKGNYSVSGMPLQPYVRANIWHSSAGTNTVTFNESTDIDTEQKSTTMDLSAGATMRVSSTVSVYGELGYESNLDSNQLNGRKGTIGVKVDF